MKNATLGLLAVCATGLLASGCGRSTSPQGAGAATTSPVPSPAVSPTASPSPAAQPASPVPVDAIDFERLVGLVPDVTGWTRTGPTGRQIKTTISYARAYADYSQGESLIRLELTDSGFNTLLLAPLSMMLVPSYWERSTEGYRRYAAVSGQPGFESWNDDGKDGEVTVVVGNRFIVDARGTSVPNIEAVRSVVQKIDFGKLAALR